MRWGHRTALKQDLESVNAVHRKSIPAHKRSTLGKLDLFLMDAILAEAEHPDTTYVSDLSAGFNVTSSIEAGSLGELLEGGQRVNRKPGQGGPEDLEELKKQCQAINSETLTRAKTRMPTTEADHDLAAEAWTKFQRDVERGYASEPLELSDIDLDNVLLVDSFPVREQHANAPPKVRVINNYRQNRVNSYAWIPSRLRYNGFSELVHASRILKAEWESELEVGKADFQSAFKTVPVADAQQWLCWALVYNPHEGRHQVTRLNTQTFGSLGAVVAWLSSPLKV